MLTTTCPTTQQHNPADWNIFYTRFLLAKNIKIPCLGCDGVQFDRGAITSICMANPDTITPQHSVTHAIPTILPALFNAGFILIMVPLCMPAKL